MAQYSLQRPWASGPWGGPFDELRREMDALFDRFWGEPSAARGAAGVLPAVNLYDTSEAYVLTAEVPGVNPNDLNVSLEGSTLMLQGERKIDYGARGDALLHRRERSAGTFRRAFELPSPIDAEKVEAVQRHGVLMLRLPKTPEQKARQISVTAG